MDDFQCKLGVTHCCTAFYYKRRHVVYVLSVFVGTSRFTEVLPHFQVHFVTCD